MSFSVKKKNLSELKKCIISKDNIYHESGKFFRIVGSKVRTNFYKTRSWHQPVILQKEKGILGILRRKSKDGFQYLIQA